MTNQFLNTIFKFIFNFNLIKILNLNNKLQINLDNLNQKISIIIFINLKYSSLNIYDVSIILNKLNSYLGSKYCNKKNIN